MNRHEIDWPSLSDEEYTKKAEMQIWLAAFASNNPRAPAHAEVDRAYSESRRRNKPWLYQKAWNAAYQSCGHTPTDFDIERARPETWLMPDDVAAGGDA